MTIRILTFIFFGVLLIGCSLAVSQFGQSHPPSPDVVVGDKTVPVHQSTYCWSSGGKGVCADSVSPPVQLKDEKPFVSKPGASLTIDFDYKPIKGTLQASLWSNGESTDQKIKNINTIILPKEQGVYIYSFSARWDEGDSSYTFKVKIE